MDNASAKLMLFYVFVLAVAAFSSEPQFIHVPDDYLTIQEAINAAAYGDTITVSAGTYVENVAIKNGTKLIGENADTCIINGNHNGVSVVSSTNCDSNTLIEGFTITNGYSGQAGGLKTDSSIVISNCMFISNSAVNSGGGAYFFGGSPTLVDCVFSGNSARSGGGIVCQNSSLSLTSCQFRSNVGGGINSVNSSLAITSCQFSGNSALYGGGVYCSGGSLALTSCQFSGNSATQGGGVYGQLSSLNLISCQFTSNSASQYGGAISAVGTYSSSRGILFITNCLFNHNSANSSGGALESYAATSITNSTFAFNSSATGGAIRNCSDNLLICNSILWGNTASDSTHEICYYELAPGRAFIAYSDVAGYGGSQAWTDSKAIDGGGNIDADPLFVDADGADNVAGTEDDDLRLRYPSPCIDAGNNDELLLQDTDLNGNARFIDDRRTPDSGNGAPPLVDIGAYESQCSGDLRVNLEYSQGGYNDGLTWGVDAFSSIQSALNAAVYGDVIAVAPGIYNEKLIMKNGVTLFGSGKENTTIDVGRTGTCITISHCDPNTIVEGFTFTNGYNTSAWTCGGMYIEYSYPTVRNCAFLANEAPSGGGICAGLSELKLCNCVFLNNVAQSQSSKNGGGAVFLWQCSSVIEKCTFTNNKAICPGSSYSGCGGGIYITTGSEYYSTDQITIRDCLFKANYARSGGGVYCDAKFYKNISLANCVFKGNYAANACGGFTGPADVTGCVFEDNCAADGPGGGLITFSDNATIKNCTFINNKALAKYSGNGGGASLGINSGSIEDCSFIGNSAYRAGGLHITSYDSTAANKTFSVKNSKFINNSSSYGGAVRTYNSNSIFTNCTLANNSASKWAGAAYIYCVASDSQYPFNTTVKFDNCILWANNAPTYPEINSFGTPPIINYCDIAGGASGVGNIDVDPLFADVANYDVHLKSQGGRWDALNNKWILDDATSTCIDAGNPDDSFGQEPFSNGGIVNMGAYGGTIEASKSYFGQEPCSLPYAGDLNGDCKIDLIDYSMLASNWLREDL